MLKKRSKRRIEDPSSLSSPTHNPTSNIDNFIINSKSDILSSKKIFLNNLTDPNLEGFPAQILELIKNKYSINLKGPYIVNIEKVIIGNVESVGIGVLKLASLLNRLTEISKFMNVAFDLKKTGLNRFLLAFLLGETTNEFVAKVWENKKIYSRRRDIGG